MSARNPSGASDLIYRSPISRPRLTRPSLFCDQASNLHSGLSVCLICETVPRCERVDGAENNCRRRPLLHEPLLNEAMLGSLWARRPEPLHGFRALIADGRVCGAKITVFDTRLDTHAALLPPVFQPYWTTATHHAASEPSRYVGLDADACSKCSDRHSQSRSLDRPEYLEYHNPSRA